MTIELNTETFPTGTAYLARLLFNEQAVQKTSARQIDNVDPMLDFFGTALSACFQIATCHPNCHGNDHILEALIGRAHNQATAAFSLIRLGYYDESLALVRGIAEIANLLTLFVEDHDQYDAWIKSNKNKRRSDFGPSAVRKKLAAITTHGAPFSEARYADLCECVTHPTPGVRPNAHTEDKTFPGAVGPIFQVSGYDKCLHDIIYVLANVAFMASAIFQRSEFVEKLLRHVDTVIDFFLHKEGSSPEEMARAISSLSVLRKGA